MDVKTSAGTTSQAAALALRYGTGAEPVAGPWNDVISTLLSHRSGTRLPAGCLAAGARWKPWSPRRNRHRRVPTCRPGRSSRSPTRKRRRLSRNSRTTKAHRTVPVVSGLARGRIAQCAIGRRGRCDAGNDPAFGDLSGRRDRCDPRRAERDGRRPNRWVCRWSILVPYEMIRSRSADCWASRRVRWAFLACVSAIRCRRSRTR